MVFVTLIKSWIDPKDKGWKNSPNWNNRAAKQKFLVALIKDNPLVQMGNNYDLVLKNVIIKQIMELLYGLMFGVGFWMFWLFEVNNKEGKEKKKGANKKNKMLPVIGLIILLIGAIGSIVVNS